MTILLSYCAGKPHATHNDRAVLNTYSHIRTKKGSFAWIARMESGQSAPWLEREHNCCALSARSVQNHCQARPQEPLTNCKQRTQPKPSLRCRSGFQHRNIHAHVCLASGSRVTAKYSLDGNHACGQNPPTPVLTPTAWQTLL